MKCSTARHGWAVLMSVLALTAASCAGPTARPPSASPTTSPTLQRRVIVDTDVAIDDVLALAALATDRSVELAAVTVSGTGEAHCGPGMGVVLHVLFAIGRTAVPVACGRTAPSAGGHAFPDAWRSLADRAYGVALPASTASPADIDAATLMARSANEATTILALGPLTNVADALDADPTLARRVQRIVVSGGAIDAHGNLADAAPTNTTAEWNIYIDPTAADTVLRSGAPVTLVPLDVTTKVPADLDLAELVAANAHRSPAATLADELLAGNPQVARGQLFLWDPTAGLVAAHPELLRATTSEFTGDGPDSGRTRRDPAGQRVDVPAGIDGTALATAWLRSVADLGPEDALTPSSLAPISLRAALERSDDACTARTPVAANIGRGEITYTSTTSNSAGAAARLLGAATATDILDWFATHRDATAPPPMVDHITIVAGNAGAVRIDLPAGRWLLACADLDAAGSLTTLRIAATIDVA